MVDYYLLVIFFITNLVGLALDLCCDVWKNNYIVVVIHD